MADIYVRSSDGNDADNGSTWALAKQNIWAVEAIDSAGDTIYVDSAFNVTDEGIVSIAIAGTVTSPSRILSVSSAGDPTPPTTLEKGATWLVADLFSTAIQLNGSFYCYGVSFRSGQSTSTVLIRMGGATENVQIFEQCDFQLVGTGTGSFEFSGSGAGKTTLKNCDIKLAAASQYINLKSSSFLWDGGTVLSGSVSPTYIFGTSAINIASTSVISGVDFSNFGSSVNIANATSPIRLILRNCKLPASWSGSLVNSTGGQAGFRAEMHNCDSGDTNYRIWIEDYAGSVKQDTGIYLDGGTTDGTTSLSYKFASSANCNFASGRLYGPEMHIWNEAVGVPITTNVEIAHSSQGAGTDGVLQNDQIWLEVMYLGTSGYPLGTWTNNAKTDVLAMATDQPISTATWQGTTSGWDTQKLSVTFTPQKKGVIVARVVMGAASKTVYVDPNITIT